MRRFLQVVRGLDRQPATGRQLREQSRIQPSMVRQPLQRGIGQDQLRRVLGLPVLDIHQLKGHLGQPLTRCAQHVCAAVDSDHPCPGHMRLQHGSGVAGATAEIDGQLDTVARYRCQHVMNRASALAFEQGILSGRPTHRHLRSTIDWRRVTGDKKLGTSAIFRRMDTHTWRFFAMHLRHFTVLFSALKAWREFAILAQALR